MDSDQYVSRFDISGVYATPIVRGVLFDSSGIATNSKVVDGSLIKNGAFKKVIYISRNKAKMFDSTSTLNPANPTSLYGSELVKSSLANNGG